MVQKVNLNVQVIFTRILSIIESQARIGDRFRDIRRIDENGGNGAFSLIFLAHDDVCNEDVILKFYDPASGSDADRLQRFQREGQILQQLKGRANIVECIDGVCRLPVTLQYMSTKITQNFDFIPLRKASGSSEQIIYSGRASPAESLVYFREMCKAVGRIHRDGICHRDLKPSNFLLFPGDDVRLSDFGTAKFLDGSMPDIRTRYYRPVGDLRYTAPETFCQIGITGREVFSSDIFSLGAILFEIFSKEVLTNW
jgi:serine/threonine protein kinase